MLVVRHGCRLKTVLRQSPWKCFSTNPTRCSAQVETIEVPCRGNGSIELNIYQPPSTSSTHVNAPGAPPLIIHLPSGTPASAFIPVSRKIPSLLAEATNVPVVQINYRLTAKHRFPAPLHDVHTGYDWVVNNLLSTLVTPALEPRPSVIYARLSTPEAAPGAEAQTPIAVYGSYVGGSLALALGLTTCRTPSVVAPLEDCPTRITAIAAHNAITEWPAILPSGVSTLEKPLITDSSKTPEQAALERLGKSFFYRGRVMDGFDPFASPALFFRTSRVSYANESEEDTSGSGEAISANGDAADHNAAETAGDGKSTFERIYARRYPPRSMGPAVLPRMLLSADEGTAFADQTSDFAELVRKAFVRQWMGDWIPLSSEDEEGLSEYAKQQKLEEALAARMAAEELVHLELRGTHTGEEVKKHKKGVKEAEAEAEQIGKWLMASWTVPNPS